MLAPHQARCEGHHWCLNPGGSGGRSGYREDLLGARARVGSDTYPGVVKDSWVLVVRQHHRREILETYS
jgi:hypothetical protein